MLQLLNKTNGSFGERDLEFLNGISDHMAIAMENATLHMELLEKQRMEQELALQSEQRRNRVEEFSRFYAMNVAPEIL